MSTYYSAIRRIGPSTSWPTRGTLGTATSLSQSGISCRPKSESCRGIVCHTKARRHRFLVTFSKGFIPTGQLKSVSFKFHKSNIVGNATIAKTFACAMLSKAKHSVTKIDSPQFKAVLSEDLLNLVKVFEENGFEIRIVGGAVRDILLGKEPPKDMDLSTNATPDQMIELFKENDIKFYETGLQHGTLTVHINAIDYEVTTLRIDTETDGRHAKVQFTNDWRLDAERRDLTINAMSLKADGTLYDYFSGMRDLNDKKVQFVGHPEKRILEDYLRILRYFRFYGRIVQEAGQHDEETLATIRKTASGLRNIAVERIWVEVSRILVGNHASHLIDLMYDLGVAEHIGLPPCSESHLKEFDTVWNRMRELEPQPVTLLMTLVDTVEQAEELCRKWKLSNAERNLAKFIVSNRHISLVDDSPLKPYQDLLILNSNIKTVDTIRHHVVELLNYQGHTVMAQQMKKWDIPAFPVNGADLKTLGVKPGTAFGKILKNLKDAWMDSYYTLDKNELLEKARVLKESL